MSNIFFLTLLSSKKISILLNDGNPAVIKILQQKHIQRVFNKLDENLNRAQPTIKDLYMCGENLQSPMAFLKSSKNGSRHT